MILNLEVRVSSEGAQLGIPFRQIVVSTDPAGQLTVNRSGLEYTGLATPHQDWAEVVHPDDREAETQAQLRAMTGRAADDLSVLLRAADGTYHAFLSHHEPMLGAHGGFGGWVTTYSGRATPSPPDREKGRETPVRATPGTPSSGVALLDAAGHVLAANEAILGGGGAGQVLGRLLWETTLMADSEDHARLARTATERAAAGAHARFTVLSVGPGGQQLILDYSLSPVRSEPEPAGRAAMLEGMLALEVRDVTEVSRLAAEREQLLLELTLERARFEAILAQMPQGVVVADLHSRRVSLINTQMERILGGPLVPGIPVSALELPSFRPDGQPMSPAEFPLTRALSGETIHGEEFEILRADGGRAVVQESAAPILDRTGQVVAAVLTIDDLTERRRAEAEVRRLSATVANAQEALRLYGGGPVTPERFTDLVGELYTQLGQPQLEGRLVALLLLHARPVSLGEAARRLGVSKVAVSKVSNVMLEHGDLQISKSFSSREHLLALTDHTYIRDLSVRRVASWAISVLCDQLLAGGDVELDAAQQIRGHLEMHARTAEALGVLLSPVELQQAQAMNSHMNENWDAVSPRSERDDPES